MSKYTKQDPISFKRETAIGPLLFVFFGPDSVVVRTPDNELNTVNRVPMKIRMDCGSYDEGQTFEQKRMRDSVRTCYRNRTDWGALQLNRQDHKDESDVARHKVSKTIHEALTKLLEEKPSIRQDAVALGRNNEIVRLEEELKEAEEVVSGLEKQLVDLRLSPFLEDDVCEAPAPC